MQDDDCAATLCQSQRMLMMRRCSQVHYSGDGKMLFFGAELQLHDESKSDSKNTVAAPVSDYFKCHTDGSWLLNSVPENLCK